MILKLLPISILQCMLLSGGQVLMKYGLTKAGDFSFTWQYFVRLFTNWQFISCGLCYGAGSILWMYIIKHFPLQHGLSDGEPELRDGYVCSHHLLPRADTYDQMDRGVPDHVWMCADCKMKR